jgi:hypothetical protein
LAKTSGITTAVTIAGNVISNDVRSITIDTPYGEQEITGLDKAAIERLLLRADVQGSLNGIFNTAASMSHATLKTPGSKTFVIAFAAAAATATFTANTTNYNVTMGEDGSLTWSANFNLNNGTALAWT